MDIVIRDIEKAIIKEIEKAQHFIKLSIPKYTFLPLLDSLVTARKRGVSIELITEYQSNESESIFQDTKEEIHTLISKIYESGAVLLQREIHYANESCEKFCLIDKNTLLVGSFSWRENHEEMNETINIIRYDENHVLVDSYFERFIKLKNLSHYDDINIQSRKTVRNKTSIYKKEEIKSETVTQPTLIPFQQDKKWGYYSLVSNEIVVQPIYKTASQFNDGLAYVQNFNNQATSHTKDNDVDHSFAFINSKGKLVTDFTFYTPTNMFSFGWASIKASQDPELKVPSTNKFGAIDYNGNIILPFIYGFLGELSEGMIIYGSDNYRGTSFFGEGVIDHYGVIDSMGNLLMPPRYQIIEPYSEGMAIVGYFVGDMLHPRFGYIDTFGNLKIDICYSSAERFSDGFAKVANSSLNFVNKNNQKLFGDSYLKKAEKFKNNLAFIEANDGFSGLIDNKGEKIMNAKISRSFRLCSNFHNGIAKYTDGLKFGFLDKDTNPITECIYTHAENHRYGVAQASDNDSKFYIDLNGNTIYETEDQETELKSFYEGLGRIVSGELLTYITPDGKRYAQ